MRGSSDSAAKGNGKRWDLTALLNAADPRAGLVERHLWLLRLTEWLRTEPGVERDQARTPLPVLRLRHLLNVLERHDEHRRRVAALLARFWDEVDVASLFHDFGYGARMSLWSELRHRLALRLLPQTPQTNNLAELFVLLFPAPGDAAWLRAIDDDTLRRLVDLLGREAGAPPTRARAGWRTPLMEAAAFLATGIAAAGFSTPLRMRMDTARLADGPFRQLVPATAEVLATIRDDDMTQAVQKLPYLRALLDSCIRAADSVHAHLEQYGVSVDIVFEVEQLKSRLRRLDELLTCLVSPQPEHDVVRLLADLAEVSQRRRSIRGLFERHYSLLARKMVERHAETGSHYITRDAGSYREMLHHAAGGGAVMAATTFLKFGIAALALAPFWTGFWSGVNYAASFIVIMLLGFTVATKQPAMTAPAMAAKLGEQLADDEVAGFVDEVTHLIRSQAAGIFGNLALVFPLVLAVQLGWQATLGAPLVGADTAGYVLHSLTLLGPTALFAAFTGVLLFASSLIAGWAENWFVLHRLDSAIAHNPGVVSRLGAARARRWADWWRRNVSGVAANVSLGMMLGLVPAVLGFLALPLEVRHVTLSTGQLAAAVGALGWEIFARAEFWWCVAGIAVTGTLNVGVSFYLAFKLALRAQGVKVTDRARIARAVRRRLRRRPLSFLLPPRSA